jgi:hypothetical protein
MLFSVIKFGLERNRGLGVSMRELFPLSAIGTDFCLFMPANGVNHTDEFKTAVSGT